MVRGEENWDGRFKNNVIELEIFHWKDPKKSSLYIAPRVAGEIIVQSESHGREIYDLIRVEHYSSGWKSSGRL